MKPLAPAQPPDTIRQRRGAKVRKPDPPDKRGEVTDTEYPV